MCIRDRIDHIQNIYRVLYQKGYNTSQALDVIESTVMETPERNVVLDFVKDASRGIIRGYRSSNGNTNGHSNGNHKNGSILS